MKRLFLMSVPAHLLPSLFAVIYLFALDEVLAVAILEKLAFSHAEEF